MTIPAKLAKGAFWLIAAAFAAVYLLRNADQLTAYDYDFSLGYVSIGFGLALLAYLLSIKIWVRIANQCGVCDTWLQHALVWSTSRLARYVPGKVAAIYLRIEGYKGRRVKASVSLYIEITSSLIAACTFILFCWAAGLAPLNPLHTALLAAGLIIVVTLSSRSFLTRLGQAVATFRNISPPGSLPSFRWWAITVLLQTTAMLLHGASLYFAVLSSIKIHPGVVLELTVYYYFAGLAGMLAIFAPAGIGVREAVLAGFMQTLVPLPVAIASVALVRIITVLAECTIWGSLHLMARLGVSSADK